MAMIYLKKSPQNLRNMMINLDNISQILYIFIAIISFYGVVTKPIKDSIDRLNAQIRVLHEDYSKTKELVVRINESVKSAHKRIDKLEDFYEIRLDK